MKRIKFLSILFFLLYCNSLTPLTRHLTPKDIIYGPQSNPRLLIKWPTRSRPDLFIKQLKNYYSKLSNKTPYHFIISCDIDDTTMNNPKMIQRLGKFPNLSVYFNESAGKVAAYNANIEEHLQDGDIVLLASDDMYPNVRNFDQVIVNNMKLFFPTGDGNLNFHDGFVGKEMSSYSIMDARYFHRFGYLFNPIYHSFCCDNEYTLVAQQLYKDRFINTVVLEHRHPAWGKAAIDELYLRSEAAHPQDKLIRERRINENFGLPANPIIWSILIPSLEARSEQFESILKKLQDQVTNCGLEDSIEILCFVDNKEFSIGLKRNALLAESLGKYICFVDDDDDVSDAYIETIYKKLLKDPDCVKLVGHYFENNKFIKPFIHSIQYNKMFDDKRNFYRPPNHLSPIRKSIACQFAFPEVNMSEDSAWAMQICRSKELKKEASTKEPLYFYNYIKPDRRIENQ